MRVRFIRMRIVALAAAVAFEFLVAVGETLADVRATRPTERMQAVAKEIAAAASGLVSLQEVDQWSSGPFDPVTGMCGPVAVEFDMSWRWMRTQPHAGRAVAVRPCCRRCAASSASDAELK